LLLNRGKNITYTSLPVSICLKVKPVFTQYYKTSLDGTNLGKTNEITLL